MRTLSFAQLDVFTDRPLHGNPLAVFPDARALAEAELLAVAREMNLSETTFVYPRAPEVERERGVRVRIFTTEGELPFAGHPTLGTAWLLRAARGGDAIALDLDAGRVPVRFETGAGGALSGEMTQPAPRFGRMHEPAAVAEAAGLPADALDPALPIETISTGVPFTIVPLRSRATLAALAPDVRRIQRYLVAVDAGGGVGAFHFVTRDTGDPALRLRARMFFGGGEDPATGSAAGCTAAWMVAHGVAAPDERVVIAQGDEMGRPSRLQVLAGRGAGGVIERVRVGGRCVEVLRGELRLA